MASTMDSMMPPLPGSYHFHYGQIHDTNNLHSVFQPPAQSPVLSRRSSQIPRPTSRSSNSYTGRKRPRLDSNTSYFSRPPRPSNLNNDRSTNSTPFTPDGSYDHVSNTRSLESSAYSCDDLNLLSPSPLANSEYKLAGGLDTPSASLERDLDELAQNEAEMDYRCNRYVSTLSNTSITSSIVGSSRRSFAQSQMLASSGMSGSTNKKKRSRSPLRGSSSLTGWGIRSTAWALTGGLAGRVFNFCINTAFRGFRAGGGEIYQIATSTPTNSFHPFPDIKPSESFVSSRIEDSHDLGGFVEDYMNSPESRSLDQDRSYTPVALKNDWQIIDSVTVVDSGDEQSPARKRSRASIAGARQRPAPYRSPANSHTGTGRGASYASPRARSSIGVSPQLQRTTSIGADPFPALRRSRPSLGDHRRSQSYLSANTTFSVGQGQISPARPSSSASMRHNESETGLSPEVLHYRRRLKAREKAQDDNLRRLNAQLKDMIREGREALGSKVEIVDESSSTTRASLHADEGFYEDSWH